jgi:hypothetical protein
LRIGLSPIQSDKRFDLVLRQAELAEEQAVEGSMRRFAERVTPHLSAP